MEGPTMVEKPNKCVCVCVCSWLPTICCYPFMLCSRLAAAHFEADLEDGSHF